MAPESSHEHRCVYGKDGPNEADVAGGMVMGPCDCGPFGWLVDLTCCGRENGTEWRPTWEEADKFRDAYLNAEGHDRSAIIREGLRSERALGARWMAGKGARNGS